MSRALSFALLLHAVSAVRPRAADERKPLINNFNEEEFHDLDLDGDGSISLAEFTRLGAEKIDIAKEVPDLGEQVNTSAEGKDMKDVCARCFRIGTGQNFQCLPLFKKSPTEFVMWGYKDMCFDPDPTKAKPYAPDTTPGCTQLGKVLKYNMAAPPSPIKQVWCKSLKTKVKAGDTASCAQCCDKGGMYATKWSKKCKNKDVSGATDLTGSVEVGSPNDQTAGE